MNARVPAAWAICPAVSRNSRLCGRCSRGTPAQWRAAASTSAIPVPSSTAEAHGASWCEAMITQWSEAPGKVATTLWLSASVSREPLVSVPVQGPLSMRSSTRRVSEGRSHRPGMGRSTAS